MRLRENNVLLPYISIPDMLGSLSRTPPCLFINVRKKEFFQTKKTKIDFSEKIAEKTMLGVLIVAATFAGSCAFSPASLGMAPLNHWHVLSFAGGLDRTKPHKFRVGELPLVTWFENATGNPTTTLDVCRHMGSRLHHGRVENGCLVCPYHGLKHGSKQAFGETKEFEGKIWWSHTPKHARPPSSPFFKNKRYASSTVQVDMEASLMDSVYNVMDITHPQYVHSGPAGFGSDIPPSDVVTHVYPAMRNETIGLSFVYSAEGTFAHLDPGVKRSRNFHMLHYPGSSWSRVTMPNGRNLFVAVDLLPIGRDRTRWFVTLRHNYLTSPPGRWLINTAARCILEQDRQQMAKQTPSSLVKALAIFNAEMPFEKHFTEMRLMFKNWRYLDQNTVERMVFEYFRSSY